MNKPLRVLFVCTANISRSAYLEWRARQMVDPTLAVFASGGIENHSHRPMDPPMAHELEARGGDGSPHRSKPVSPEQLAWADLVLTATMDHRRELLRRRPDLARSIFTLSQFLASAELTRTDEPLVPAAFRRRVAAHSDDDLADPFGDRAATSDFARVADAHLSRLRALLTRSA